MAVANEWLPFARFLLCLAASAGLHLGLAIVEWPLETVQAQAVRSPLNVTLVSAAPVVQHDVMMPEQQPTPRPVRSEATVRQADPPQEPVSKSQFSSQQQPSPQRSTMAAAGPTVKERPLSEESLPLCRPQAVEVAQTMSEPPELPVVEKVQGETIAVAESFASLNLLARLDDQATSARLDGAVVSEQDAALTEARPMYSSNRLPAYPRLARQRRWEGVVWLKATVSSQGGVTALEVDSSSGHKILDQAARRAVWQWSFQPARRGKVAVEAKVRVPVRFELRDS